MLITRKETFMVGKLEFSSLEEAREHIENRIGAVLDGTNPRLAPRQAISLLNSLIDNRRLLCELLSAEVESGDWNGITRSIFDVDY